MSEEQKTKVKVDISNSKNIWRYFIPLTFFMLSLVLIFQNILLNKKLDTLSAKVTATISAANSENADLFSNLEKKLAEATQNSGSDKQSLDKLEELKSMLQDIRGLSLDGNVSSSQSDIIVDEVQPNSGQQISNDKLMEKQFTASSAEYVKELDKLSEQLTARQKSYDEVLAEITTVTEKLVVGKTEEVVDVTSQGILKKFVKVKKVGEIDDATLPELLKEARSKFEKGNSKECAEIFAKINLTRKDEDISKLLEKLKIFEINALDYNLIISKLKSVIQNLRGE